MDSTGRPDIHGVLARASAALGFPTDRSRDQEWGYLNADCARVADFLDYDEAVRSSADAPQRDLMELILYSYGELLRSDRAAATGLEPRMIVFARCCFARSHRMTFCDILTTHEQCDKPLRDWLREALSRLGIDPNGYTDERRW